MLRLWNELEVLRCDCDGQGTVGKPSFESGLIQSVLKESFCFFFTAIDLDSLNYKLTLI